eukprot:1812151-Pyramimonas_sp.AAC.2
MSMSDSSKFVVSMKDPPVTIWNANIVNTNSMTSIGMLRITPYPAKGERNQQITSRVPLPHRACFGRLLLKPPLDR